VAKYEDLLLRVPRGGSDANIPFKDLRHLLGRLGFDERVRGDHYIFTKDGVMEILNLQPRGTSGKAVSGQAGPRRDCEVPSGRR
jgi:hypothetical protein